MLAVVLVVLAQQPACQRWQSPGLMEGPAFLGYAEADLGVGRRACPRSELGIGFNFGAIIDTPNFYGAVGIQGLLYGSWAFTRHTELFADFEVFDSQFTQDASLYGVRQTIGNATIGLSQHLFEGRDVADAISARLLLPTGSNIPGARELGGELGDAVSWRPARILEVHAYAGLRITGALSPAPLPQLGFAGTLGVQLSPVSWASLVVDAVGGVGAHSYFAPTAALRFRLFSFGVEVAVSRPLFGTDRHDIIGAARIAYRL